MWGLFKLGSVVCSFAVEFACQGNRGTMETETTIDRDMHVRRYFASTADTHDEPNVSRETMHDTAESEHPVSKRQLDTMSGPKAKAKRKRQDRWWSRISKSAKIEDKWYKTERAYRKAVEAWRIEQDIDRVEDNLREAVAGAIATLKLAGETDVSLAKVEQLYTYLNSSAATCKEAVDRARRLLNELGKQAPLEANLWYIETRTTDR
jgi:hypothetical protein